MDPVPDEFLSAIAGISASLIGLFLVGMILYLQAGFERTERTRGVVEPYFRAATLITFISLAMPLGVSLTLWVLPIGWSRSLFGVLVVGLIAANGSTVDAVRTCVGTTGLRLLWVMEGVGTVLVTAMVVGPGSSGATPRDGGPIG